MKPSLEPFLKVEHSLLDNEVLTSTEKCLYMLLRRLENAPKGCTPSYAYLKRKLKIKDIRKLATFSGISGKPCTSKTQCHIPINVAGSTGNFKSQELPNSQCPAILGLNGLEGNKILLIPHDDRVIIPNGGQVKITVSKEVQIVKCLRTPSGHLLLPCDEWTKKSSGRDTPLCLFQGEVTP